MQPDTSVLAVTLTCNSHNINSTVWCCVASICFHPASSKFVCMSWDIFFFGGGGGVDHKFVPVSIVCFYVCCFYLVLKFQCVRLGLI